MRIAILGFGREGKAVFNFLKKSKAYKNSEIWILDKNPNILTPQNTNHQLGKNYLKNLDKFNIIFRSPGVPYNLPQIVYARKKRVKISSGTKLFFEKAKNKAKLIIGITGTKGKGTTSTLIYKILKNAQKKVILAGNIGRPALNYLNKINKNTIVVLELSSFQLEDLSTSPHLAIILDIFPDHQDAHSSIKEYFRAKSNICRHQTKKDVVFYFKNIGLSKKLAMAGLGRKIGVDENKINAFSPNDLKILGKHNFRNAAMAYSVASYLKIPQKIILRTIKSFKGLEHRLEFVRKIKIGKDKHIYFYNDSASSNPNSSQAAALSFPKKQKILILGGRDKGLNYKPLSQAIKKIEKEVALILIFGENKHKILTTIQKEKISSKIKLANTLKEVIKTAKEFAQKLLLKNQALKDVFIVFSPGATSFDMFNNYAQRGEKFKQLVKSIK